MAVEPINLNVIDEVYGPDHVAQPIWYPFPELEGTVDMSITFDYSDYIYGADEFQIKIANGNFQEHEGVFSYVPHARNRGSAVEVTIRAIDSKTRAFKDQILMINVV